MRYVKIKAFCADVIFMIIVIEDQFLAQTMIQTAFSHAVIVMVGLNGQVGQEKLKNLLLKIYR